MTSDTIADMLTRVRNANSANHRTVAVPASKMKVEIARVLTAEGFVEDYEVATTEGAPSAMLTLTLKPRTARGRALSGLRRISKPGLRVYARKSEIPRVLGGLGIAIISTSHGLMTGSAAQSQGLGGEVVAYVW
jgi:small subunit ribosomal protein S8